MSERLYKTNKKIDQIKSKLNTDADTYGPKQRFGFFGINYSAYLGDEHYSAPKEYKRDADGKVYCPPRGIYAHTSKKGKGTDAFFSADIYKTDDKMCKRLKEIAQLERKDQLEKVAKSKEKAENFRTPFVASSVQEYKDSIYPDKMNYKNPLYKVSPKQKNIDHENRTVKTERRGIYSQPMKKGSVAMKGVLFEYQRESLDYLAKKKKLLAEERRLKSEEKKRLQKQQFDQPFKPAALEKCSTFQTDKEMYAENPDKIKELMKQSKEDRKLSKKKYDGSPPKGCVEHNKAFFPAQLSKSGLPGYFKPMFGYPFVQDKKVVKIDPQEAKKKRLGNHDKEYVLNRLVDSSLFSPAITTALPNLKKEFPSVFHY